MAKSFRSNEDQKISVEEVDTLTADPVWDGMPLADFQRFGRYVREVADALGLVEWEISLRLRPDDGEDTETSPLASIKVANESRFATLRLAHSFASEPNHLQQVTLIHEVLHIHLEPLLTTLTEEILPEALGAQAASVATAYLGTEKERTIDALAVALSPRMPSLPKK